MAARRTTSTSTTGCRRRRRYGKFHGMEAAMNRGRRATTAISLLIGIGLLLSACVEGVDYGGPAYAYSYPAYDSLYYGWGGWHHGWDHGHWDGHGEVGHEFHG